MKSRWLQLIVLLFLLFVQALPAQAAQAVAYATILIVIPPRPEAAKGQVQQAKEESKTDKEKGAMQERVLLTEEQKEEVKTSE